MPNGTCSIIDGGVPCPSPVLAREMCSKHYGRWNKYGDPLFVGKIGRPKGPVQDRSEDDCHDPVCAHDWADEHFVKPVPEGLMVDHVKANGCTMRHCVNFLRHLEPVTNRENCLRGNNTKLSDEVVATLYARWRAGEKSVDLATEVGTHRTNLLKRFRRVTDEAA